MYYFDSSAIATADYNPWSLVMTIQFTSGGTCYPFYNVPQSVFQGLLSAASPGEYYNRYIRGRYR